MTTNDMTTVTTRTTVLRSTEFTCPSCIRKVEKALYRLPGVYAATVHFNTGRIVIEHGPSNGSPPRC